MNQSSVLEETITFENNDATLEGTLSLPEGQPVLQAVLMIAGSGPLDRNQNSLKVQLNLFNDIATHLAQSGIASLRYDKRGCGKSTGDYNSTGHSDLVNDAAAALRFLQEHTATSGSPMFILGHSEGTLIAPQVIARADNVSGQILLAPYVEEFTAVIRRQAEKALAEVATLPGFKGKLIRLFLRISGDQIKKQQKLIERIRKTSKPTIKIKKQVINAKWIREMAALDAPAIHAKSVLPTLAIGGAKDLQCLPGDVDKLQQIMSVPIQTHVIPDLTHILRRDFKEASTQHYTELSLQPVDAELLDSVTRWLKDQRA